QRDEDHAQTLEWIEITQIESLQQSEREKEGDGHQNDATGDLRDKPDVPKTCRCRGLHRSFQNELGPDEANERNNDEKEGEKTHRRSSICAIGFATNASPITTSAIPHQRSGEINSPRKIQQPSGTRISTTRDRGKAMVSGIYLST